MNKKNIKILILLIIILIGVIFLIFNKKEETLQNDKFKIVTSFYPLYFFASYIGGDNVEVYNIVPSGAEPHSYEPTAKDMALIENGDLIILNGGGFESWASDLENNILDKNKLLIAGEGLFTLSQEYDNHGDGNNDPHIWLSPSLAMYMVDSIETRLSLLDDINKEYYASNALSLKQKLVNLDLEFKNNLSNCQMKDIVTSHMAFAYLAKDYGFRQVPISGLSPEEEPSFKDIIKIIKFVEDNNIKYIFFESLMSPKFSETIANETGAKTLVLNPIAGLTKEEINMGKDYFILMEENLSNLKIALQCK